MSSYPTETCHNSVWLQTELQCRKLDNIFTAIFVPSKSKEPIKENGTLQQQNKCFLERNAGTDSYCFWAFWTKILFFYGQGQFFVLCTLLLGRTKMAVKNVLPVYRSNCLHGKSISAERWRETYHLSVMMIANWELLYLAVGCSSFTSSITSLK